MPFKSIALSLVTALTLGFGVSAQATVYTSTNVPVTICDVCDVSSSLAITSHSTITDLNVLLNNLTHTWDGDLLISLIAPNSTTVVLSNRRGSSGDNFIGTVFDDEASTAVGNSAAPFTGALNAEELLSVFDGMDAFGTWTLRVQDLASADVGSINSWGLNITSTTQNVPEPGSLALMGLGLAGLAATRRRKSV
ncbi:hypothetical protein os1_04750 [Comamonadaceae bacterium OS-1]|nr:hypothetical protein os1_04750 [Comamonadaceae bacterium OS-1]